MEKTHASLESGARSKRRRVQVEQIILGTLTAAGALSFAIMAPKAVSLLKHVDLNWAHKRDPRQRLRECVSRMKRKGLVTFETSGGKTKLTLTAAGRSTAERAARGAVRIPIPRRWDGRWRIVIFDVPERRRPLRRHFRTILQNLGFVRLQDSVWVHPYDCEEIIALLKADLKTGAQVLYIIADAMEYDTPLRNHFGLPALRR